MTKFNKWFESLMSAVTFSEADCPDMAIDEMKGQKVLLVLTGGEKDARSFKYALNSSKRVGAPLEVLLFGKEADRDGFQREAGRISDALSARVNLVGRSGCTGKQVIDYIERRNDILFVVADSKHILNAGCPKDGALRGLWKKLKCPLVLVSEPEG